MTTRMHLILRCRDIFHQLLYRFLYFFLNVCVVVGLLGLLGCWVVGVLSLSIYYHRGMNSQLIDGRVELGFSLTVG